MDIKNIYRVEKNKNYTVINNEILKRPDLSWKAKGIMAYILSLPDDWVIHLNEIMEHSTDGEASFRSGWRELTDLGYVERKPIREDGLIKKWETTIYESLELKGNCGKLTKKDVQSQSNQLLGENLDVENLDVGNLDVENHKLLNTNIYKVLNILNTDFIKRTDKEEKLIQEFLEKIIISWNEIDELHELKNIDDKRLSVLSDRLNEYGVYSIFEVIDNIKGNKYLRGYGNNKWKCTFDWVIKERNYLKILENQYQDLNFKSKKNGFHNFRGQSENYTAAEIENIARSKARE